MKSVAGTTFKPQSSGTSPANLIHSSVTGHNGSAKQNNGNIQQSFEMPNIMNHIGSSRPSATLETAEANHLLGGLIDVRPKKLHILNSND